MEIKKSAFVSSAASPGNRIKSHLKQIAVVGKSNVGKSSFINLLTNDGKLARTGKLPGRTRLINYFLINDEFFLTDLPGYGFAKTSQENKDTWSTFIDDYIKSSPSLVMVGLLIDLRHPGLPIDMKAYEWLREIAPSLVVIGTKEDKLKRNEARENLKKLNKLFPADYPAISYSSLNGDGRDSLYRLIEQKVCE